jgi:hypothetical protein
MRYNLLIVAVSLFLLAGSSFGQGFGAKQEPPKKDGWWIRVDTKNPASGMMGFYLGKTNHSYGLWSIWNPGSPAEFDVSDEFKNSPTVYILAQTTSGVKCGFCIMYKNKGVKHVVFELEQDHDAKQSDEDKECK